MKLLKITNPLWLGQIAPRIKDFFDRTKEPGLTYESRFTFLANSVQFGKEQSEFTVVFENNQPIAFAHWCVLGLPFIGTVLFESLHNWSKKREPINLLIKEFINFGKKHNATVYRYEACNEKVAGIIERYVTDLGSEVSTSDSVRLFISTKKEK